ncbi:hypothetical protein [Enterococcus timonensis]|uniref:hypothetical protein n=1 Tax=Enterococcus timonensis TaxID=1852364 RepID=UPI0008D95FBF|nr:hypothetical protein [Enterococcus timonensis]
MNTLKIYLDGLFKNLPKTPENHQLYDDLLANAEDRYQELTAEGLDEASVIGKIIAEMGSAEELTAEFGGEEQDQNQSGNHSAYDQWTQTSAREKEIPAETKGISGEFFEEQQKVFRRNILLIALGVMIFFMGSGLFIANQSYGPRTLFFLGAGLALIISIILLSLGSVNLILQRQKLAGVSISEEAKRAARYQLENFSNSAKLCLVLGIGVFLLGFLPVIFLAVHPRFSMLVGFGLLLMINGLTAFLFIYGFGNRWFLKKFSQEKIFAPKMIDAPERSSADVRFDGWYWPAVWLLFMVSGFLFHAWAVSWLIFPVAAIVRRNIRRN